MQGHIRSVIAVGSWLTLLVVAAALGSGAPSAIPRHRLALAAYKAAPVLAQILPRGSYPREPPDWALRMPERDGQTAPVVAPARSGAAGDPVAAWKAWTDAIPGAVAPWTTWQGIVPADLDSWIAWRDVAMELNVHKLMFGLDRQRAAPWLALLHVCATFGISMLVRLLARPAVPVSLLSTWAWSRRIVLPTAVFAAWSSIPLIAFVAGLPWFWTEFSQTPAAWQPPYFVVRQGSLPFWLVWLGAGLIYLRLQVAITRRLITRAVARLDADPHHCGRCGYARAPGGLKCPECGWTYATTDRCVPRLLRWPRGRFGRRSLEAAFWALVIVLLNAPYTLALACRFTPDSWERALAPWLNHYG